MYLTGGQFKGHKIYTPDNTRPTLSKVRESIFNMLFSYFDNKGTFLDMFTGSAIMGLEAISRGYSVVELEINPKTAKVIKENYKKIKQIPDITVVDSLKYKTDKKFDIIYIDPPWNYDYSLIIKKAKDLIENNGIIVIEHDLKREINLDEIIREYNLEFVKQKKYGRTLISFIKLK